MTNFIITKPAGAFLRLIAFICDNLVLIAGAQCFGLLIKLLFAGLDATTQVVLVMAQMFLQILVAIGYYVYFVQSKWQGTPGQMLLKLCVEDKSGNRLSWRSSLLRYICWGGTGILLYPAFLMIVLSVVAALDLKEVMKVGLNISADTLGLAVAVLCGFMLIALVLSLAWLAPIFFTKQKTTAYDMLSQTFVVRKVRSKAQAYFKVNDAGS